MDVNKTRNQAEQYIKSQLRKIAKDIVGIDRRINNIERTSQSPYRSVSGGSTTYYDENGQVRQIVGVQPDGTFTSNDFNAPPPPQAPSAPIIETRDATLIVSWDGKMAGGATAWPADFSHVEVHVSTEEVFFATNSTKIATLFGRVGESVSISLPGETEYWVCLVAVNTSGTRSAQSELRSAIVENIDVGIKTFRQDNAPTGLDTNNFGYLWYDTNDGNKLYFWTGTSWVETTDETVAEASATAAAALSTADDALNAAQTAQATADGAIRTYYASNPPWANGTTQPASALGDMWFDEDDGQAYRWNGTSWQIIEDSSISVALAAAQNAQTTADGKITAYYAATAPTTAETGDLWYDTDDSNKPYYWDGSSWQLIRDGGVTTALSQISTVVADLNTLETTVDGKATTYFLNDPPWANGASGHTFDAGDLWFDINDNNKMYRWVEPGKTWTLSDDQRINSALVLASGKVTSFYQASPPVATAIGDLWIDTDDNNKMYRASSVGADQIAAGEWVLVQDSATALATANGKNKVTYSTLAPGTTANNVGDVWFQKSTTNDVIVAQFVGGGGTSWLTASLNHEVIASLDIGKATVGTLDVANRINTGAVTSREIDVEFLKAGFVLTGRIDVGSSYWNTTEGIVIPQPDGSRTQLPADGVTPARLAGFAILKAATIEKDLNLNGTTNQITGKVTLSNGISAPTSAPLVYQSWNTRYSSSIDNGSGGWQVYRGACSAANADHLAVGVNFGGAGIRVVNKNTGDIAVLPDPTFGKSWTGSFYPQGGIAFANSHYFVYGQDGNRSSGWYIYKINANFDKVNELYIGPYTIHNGNQLRITASSATGGVYLVFCNDANQVRMFTWDTNLGFLSDNLVYTAPAPRNIEAVYVGPGDFGSNKVLIGTREDGYVAVWALSGLVRQSQFDFSMGNYAKIQGLHYDAALGKFISFDQQGRIVHYSNTNTQARALTVTYTWYDGDGTVRETTPSPVASFTQGARTQLSIETPPAPDSGVTDPSRVDKANRIGLYVGIGAAARRNQVYLGVDGSGNSIKQYTTESISTGTPVEPVTNTFGGGTLPPATIVSGAVDGLGAPYLELSGSGDARVRNLTVTGTVTRPDGVWTTYTPVLTPASGSLFAASATGKYIVVDGKVVHFTARIALVDAGTASGAGLFFSLPFNSASGYEYVFAGRENQSNGSMLQGLLSGGSSNVNIFRYDNTTATITVSGRTLIFSGTYEKA